MGFKVPRDLWEQRDPVDLIEGMLGHVPPIEVELENIFYVELSSCAELTLSAQRCVTLDLPSPRMRVVLNWTEGQEQYRCSFYQGIEATLSVDYVGDALPLQVRPHDAYYPEVDLRTLRSVMVLPISASSLF